MNETRSKPASEQLEANDHPLESIVLRNVRTHEALARFAGDEDRYRHWLIEFVDHGPAAAAQIRQAVTGGSHETAINLVHGLKGRTGMLGMAELHSIALSLEMTLKNGEPTLIWLEELERTVEEMSKEITSVLGKIEA
jgi:HPt (histidine-containing phosphotransfer) domain-containing protein